MSNIQDVHGNNKLTEKERLILLKMQQDEIDGHFTYQHLARYAKGEDNKKVLIQMSNDEKQHYLNWKKYTGVELKPRKVRIMILRLMGRILGFTFTLKKVESGEEISAANYKDLIVKYPEAEKIMREEERHEEELMSMLDEERLQYVGSMVLGLNDALVELTGTIAGLTFALQSTRLVALSGLITGISATLSMASSEYLSAKSNGEENALKSSIYTGIAYLVTVVFLTLPYLLLPDNAYAWALGIMLVIVILIIFFFNYYISVAKSLPFKKRFMEMAGISLSVALISFAIGLLVKKFLGVTI